MWVDSDAPTGYPGTFGFAGETDDNLSILEKALVAGAGQGFGSQGARALIPEDLEMTLHSILFNEQHFAKTLFQRLMRFAVRTYSTVHEFNQWTDYGETGFFSPEVSTINPVNSDFLRKYAQVRFIRSKRQVSKVLLQTRTQVDPIAAEVTAATRFLTAGINRYLFEGDSTMTPDEWDGLYNTNLASGLGSTTHLVDLAGTQIAKSNLHNAAQLMADENSWALGTDLFLPNEMIGSLDKVLVGDQDRINLFPGQMYPNATGLGEPNSFLAGQALAGFRTSFGPIMFNSSNFTRLRPTLYKYRGSQTATASVSSGGPNTPVVALTAFSATGSRMAAGVYTYQVTAENSAGESLATSTATVTVTTGQGVQVQIAAPQGGWGNTPTAFRIYRSVVGGTAVYLIGRVAYGKKVSLGSVAGPQNVTIGAISGTFTQSSVTYTSVAEYDDGDQRIANTHRMYLLDLMSPGETASLGWAMLAPMGKDNLPPGDTIIQWIQFIYGCPLYYAPNKMVIFDNVSV